MSDNTIDKEKIYEAYKDRVMKYLYARVYPPEEAEDICHDVFVKVFRCWDHFDSRKSSLSTWILNITKRTLIDYYRTKHLHSELDDRLLSDDFTVRLDSEAELDRAVSALSDKQRKIVKLRYLDGYNLKKISELTGISYGMVKVHHRDAMQNLRKYLEA